MGILTGAFERRAGQWYDVLEGMIPQTASGATVTTEGSLKNTTVFACVRVLAESVASLPLIVYERLGDGRGKRRAGEHSLYRILHDLSNTEMTSVELRETLMGHLALWGNAYGEIERDRGGRVRGLWPLRPDQMTVQRVAGRLIYVYQLPDGQRMTLPADMVMHLRGLSTDGVMGYSPIALARQAVGLALATEEFGSRFFGNGARPGGVLQHPGVLSKDAQDRLRKSLESRHRGLSNAHRLMILEEGMTLKEVGIPPEDAQFLETRRFQVAEIARMFRVPLHMVGELERATNNNIEHQSLEFVIHTLRPWLVRWEQAISRDLLTPAERARYFAEHLIDGLLRGDIKSRYEAYATGRQNGWLSANDIRELENQNPVEGGDMYLVPLNMVPVEMVMAQPRGETPPEPEPQRATRALDRETRARNVAIGRQRLATSFAHLFEEAAGRVYRREINDVRGALGKHLGKRGAADFKLWLIDFYEEHAQFWRRVILPLLVTYAEQIGAHVATETGSEPGDIRAFIEEYAETLGKRQAGDSLGQLRALLDEAISQGNDPAEAIEARLGEWDERRAGKFTQQESYRANNALAKAFYILVGVLTLRWVSVGGNCPYCRALNGRTVGIYKAFLPRDTDFQPEGADSPLNIRHDAGHPPIHRGCDCMVVAG
jgi:HK97 family phage portal protein